MDPNANLAEQLRLANNLLADDEPSLEDAQRLAELVEALNDWLRGGGFQPDAWR
jgi:hypothetical protein